MTEMDITYIFIRYISVTIRRQANTFFSKHNRTIYYENEDLIENEKGGYCVDLENESFNIYINKILELDLSRSMAAFNYNKVSNYSIKKVNLKMREIYERNE